MPIDQPTITQIARILFEIADRDIAKTYQQKRRKPMEKRNKGNRPHSLRTGKRIASAESQGLLPSIPEHPSSA